MPVAWYKWYNYYLFLTALIMYKMHILFLTNVSLLINGHIGVFY